MILNKEEFKKAYTDKFTKIHGKSLNEGTVLDQYMALAGLVRDEITDEWIESNGIYGNGTKQVYYFSMEFLLGKLLESYLLNLGMRDLAREALKELDISLEELEKQEYDAGLGNGGLGRLGACFLESLSALGIPGHGCGIRYKYGLFKQKIVDGFQVELPDDWLKDGNVWEIRKADKAVEVRFGGTVRVDQFYGRMIFVNENYESVLAVPYDMPMVGYKNRTVNTLRLWSAEAITKDFDFTSFNRGEYLKAVEYKYAVESISQVLYPDDSNDHGKLLRLKQQYFLVSAGLQSIVNRYKKKHKNLDDFANQVAIHINDTHPALCIPELMRLLLDQEGMGWEEAWNITTTAISYTNHTILPEAMEVWPAELIKTVLPRIYMILEEINNRLCWDLCQRFYGNWERINQMAVISEGSVRMTNLAVVGSSHVNGVSGVHSELLKNHILNNYYEIYPQKFSNKTNGISHRRFLLKANPGLADLITETIGPAWIKEPEALKEILKYASDAGFQDQVARVKRKNKLSLARHIGHTYAMDINPESIFDVQVKRIHAYKRQLLNIFHITDLYIRLKEKPHPDIVPRTFIMAGKAAPGYYMAKKIIKLVNTLADKVNNDRDIDGKLKVLFMENYNVTQAEIIIPSADVSEQISTASKEASGTGNMKFMMNGAVTLGTMDGANVEIREAVGDDNIVIFGLTIAEVLEYYRHGGYSARGEYENNTRLKTIVDHLTDGYYPGVGEEFKSIYNSLLSDNDEFFVLKDFASYVDAQQRINDMYLDRSRWLEMCIHNIAQSGRFYSDRTISEYAREIWNISPAGPVK